jgi:hypothetical protein
LDKRIVVVVVVFVFGEAELRKAKRPVSRTRMSGMTRRRSLGRSLPELVAIGHKSVDEVVMDPTSIDEVSSSQLLTKMRQSFI